MRKQSLPLNLTREALWQFSIDYYAHPNNAKALLQLQDEYGANVNLCLLLKYCESLQISISEQDIAHLHHTVLEFSQHYTGQIRALRKACKHSLKQQPNYTHLRQHLLDAELEFEKIEQTLLIEKTVQLSLLAISQPLFSQYLGSVLLVPMHQQQSLLAQLS
jgi:uncharacterized protein (TIGR02444 family)